MRRISSGERWKKEKTARTSALIIVLRGVFSVMSMHGWGNYVVNQTHTHTHPQEEQSKEGVIKKTYKTMDTLCIL